MRGTESPRGKANPNRGQLWPHVYWDGCDRQTNRRARGGQRGCTSPVCRDGRWCGHPGRQLGSPSKPARGIAIGTADETRAMGSGNMRAHVGANAAPGPSRRGPYEPKGGNHPGVHRGPKPSAPRGTHGHRSAAANRNKAPRGATTSTTLESLCYVKEARGQRINIIVRFHLHQTNVQYLHPGNMNERQLPFPCP